jgi:transposase
VEVVHPKCAGIDVHKRQVTVCVRVAQARQVRREVRTYETTTRGLVQLMDWLRDEGVTHVAMESTGPYWRPVWHVLEGAFELVLANARAVKNVPGRKSDLKDAEWLADLFAHGLIRSSMIPPEPIQELRDLMRTRKQLVRERVRQTQRLQKILEYANIKLSSVVTDILGVSGRRILVALINGETNPDHLATLGDGRLKASKDELREALRGFVTEHHRFMLKLHLDHVAAIDRSIEAIDAQMERCLHPFRAIVEHLDTLPGVDTRAAAAMIAEMGTDMSRFPSHAHLLSWAGLCPRLDETAGKARSTRLRMGDRWLKIVMIQAAWAAVKKKETYCHAKYLRVKRRRGEKKAIVAVAASLLTAAYYMIRDGQDYRDLGSEYFSHLDRDRIARRLMHRLHQLGLDVEVRERVA